MRDEEHRQAEIEVVELEPDCLTDFEALAMCSCEIALEDVFGRPHDEELTIRAGDLVREVERTLESHFGLTAADQRRYAETLIHPAVASLGRAPERALILGGGDGLAARELLRYQDTGSVKLVDERQPITQAFAKFAGGVELSDGALADERVEVVNAKAQDYVAQHAEPGAWDLIVFDVFCRPLLDDHGFYKRAVEALSEDGVIAVQSVCPAPESRADLSHVLSVFDWVGLDTAVAHLDLESVGPGNVVLAARKQPRPERTVLEGVEGLSFINQVPVEKLFANGTATAG